MSTSRIKTLVIAALLLINLFFLSDVLIARIGQVRQQRQIIADLRIVMQNSNITLTDDAIHDSKGLDLYSTARDPFSESVIARSILGNCETVDSGSVTVTQYQSPRGTARFNARGDFSVELTEEFLPGGSPLRAAKKLLRNMKVEASDPKLTMQDGRSIVTALCMYKGTPAFNCAIRFEFDGEVLISVSGRRPSGVAEVTTANTRDFPTAMLEFLSFVNNGGANCSAILSVEAGYRLNVGGFGDGELSPGWHITTDSGAYFIDAVSGEIVLGD